MSQNLVNNLSKCIFLDLDGVCFQHLGSLSNILLDNVGTLLPGVREKFNEWAYKGYHIVITTARPESLRSFTEAQLEYHALFYDKLVMGLPRGPRVVINDIKPAVDEHPELLTAEAVNIPRNEGLENVNV